MTDEILALRDAMHDAATESFFAAERFGKASTHHLNMVASYCFAANAYEMACEMANVSPYATYSED